MMQTYTKISDEIIKQCQVQVPKKHCIYCACTEKECIESLLEILEAEHEN